MRQLSILLATVAVIVFSACSITNQVHFNKDYSGNYAMIVDLGDMMEMAKSFDPSMEDSLSIDGDPLGELISEEDRARFDSMFASMEGISNANYVVDKDYVMTMSFDFEDIDALNGLFEKWMSDAADAANSQPEFGDMGGLGGFGSMAAPSFTKDGKTIIHTAEMPLDPGQMGEAEGMDDMDISSMMDGFAGMMDYQVVMTFDRKIKSVGGEGYDILSQEKKSLKTRIDMKHLMESGSYKIAVQLK